MLYIKVTCVDVTAGGLAASCDTDGQLLVWTIDNGELRVRLSVLLWISLAVYFDLIVLLVQNYPVNMWYRVRLS